MECGGSTPLSTGRPDGPPPLRPLPSARCPLAPVPCPLAAALRMSLPRFTWFVCKRCAHCACSFLVWSVWLVLLAVLGFQIHIAVSRKLDIPPWLLRHLESRSPIKGLRAEAASASVHPAGHFILRDVRLFSDDFADPLLTARVVESSIDPWARLTGSLIPSALTLRGVELRLPAVLAPSGRAEAIVQNLDLTLRIQGREATIDQLSARIANLTLSARGGLTFPKPLATEKPKPAQILEQVLHAYIQALRAVATHAPRLEQLDAPHLALTLKPHPFRLATAQAPLTANAAHGPADLLRLGSPTEQIILGPLTISTTLPLHQPEGWTSRVALHIASATAPGGLLASDVALALTTSFAPNWKPAPHDLTLAARRLSFQGLTADHLSARVSGAWPRLNTQLGFHLFDAPWTLTAATDFSERSGSVTFSSQLTPALLAQASLRAKRDLSVFLQPAAPPSFHATVRLAPRWKFSRVDGFFTSGPVVARNVAIDAASGEFSLAGGDLLAHRVHLTLGASEARGSYWMNTATRDFRFLLTGGLRPPEIGGWFSQWWPNFWSNFDFTAAIPQADIDIAGTWGFPYRTTVFVQVEAPRPAIKQVPFDHVRTTLFIRPDFYDGLELFAAREGGTACGTFTRTVDLAKNAMHTTTFNVASEHMPLDTARVFGKVGTEIVEPFAFTRPPRLKVTGQLDGPASPDGVHESAEIDVASTGPFTFFGLSLSDLSSHATLDDDDLQLAGLRVGFAGGLATGRARMTGRGAQRRLGFDATIENAQLGESIRTLEEFGARRKNEPASPASKFQERVAPGRINLRLSADGNYTDLYSFVGNGSGEIDGAELAEVNLLGALSEVLRSVRVLNFTSLRLNFAQANFKLARNRLEFPEMKISGPTAAIDLKGIYRLDLRQMDFGAKHYPFEQSKNPLASALDLVLTPVSSILQLRLEGKIDQPRWRFAYGPSSFFRSLSGKTDPFAEQPPTTTPAPAPPPSLRRR